MKKITKKSQLQNRFLLKRGLKTSEFKLTLNSLNKKSQLQIGESVAVLIIFFMFLIFGLMFFLRYQEVNLAERAQRTSETTVISIAQKVSSMPELRCSEEKSLDVDCFDLNNVETFSKLLPEYLANNTARSQEYFWDSYQYSEIRIRKLNHFNKQWGQPYLIYSNKNNISQNQKVTYIPVILRNVSVDNPRGEYYFGMLEIETYYSGSLK